MQHKSYYLLENLHNLLRSNINLLDSIKLLINNENDLKLKTALLKIKIDLSNGCKLHRALDHNLKINKTDLELIKLGENTGKLSEILILILNKNKKMNNLKNKIIQSLIYPTLLLISSMILVIFAVNYLIPKILLLSDNNNLPVITKCLLYIYNFFSLYFNFIIIFFILIMSYIFYLYLNNLKFKLFIHKLILTTPGINNILITYYHNKFCFLLKNNLEAGIIVNKAIDNIICVINNLYYKIVLKNLEQHISNGNKINSYMLQNKIFPNIMSNLINIGENSGSLDIMLFNLNNYFENKLNNQLEYISSLLTPILTTIMGIIIAAILMAIYLPLLNLGDF